MDLGGGGSIWLPEEETLASPPEAVETVMADELSKSTGMCC